MPGYLVARKLVAIVEGSLYVNTFLAALSMLAHLMYNYQLSALSYVSRALTKHTSASLCVPDANVSFRSILHGPSKSSQPASSATPPLLLV